MIECTLWPMSILTRPVGSKNRKLICHPKDGVLRSGIKRDENGWLRIIDPKAIKIKDGVYFREIKEQGHRHFFCRDNDGKYHIYGRRLNVDKTYTDIYEKLKEMKLPIIPKNTVIDFELVYPGHPDSEVSSGIKDCPSKLKMIAFAVPIYENKNFLLENSLPLVAGRTLLYKILLNSGMDSSNLSKVYPRTKIEGKGIDTISFLENLLNEAEGKGIEGYVLKTSFCNNWYKLKGINEADVIITGFKISESKTRFGLVTAVKIGCYGKDGEMVDMGNVSGFKMEEMVDMTKAHHEFKATEKNPYFEKVIRVIYQEIAGKGKMKHGFFDGFRDDKNKQSCSTTQFN